MSTVAWIVTAGSCLLAGIVAAELCARWWLRRQGAYYVWPPGFRRRLWVDLEAFPTAEPSVRFEVNSIGERGDEPPAANENAYRILVAGGSAAECGLLDQGTSWPGALQRLLSRAEVLRALGVSRVHVGNIGKSSVDSQALEKVLSRVLPRYERLDLIVVLVGASNILRWLEQGAPNDAAASQFPDAEFFEWHPNGPFGWHPRAAAMGEVARRVRMRVLRPTLERSHAGRFMTRARAMKARARANGQICADVGDPSVMLAAWETSLRAALSSARQHSNRVILARQPWYDKPCYTPEEDARFWHGGFGDAYIQDVTKFCSCEALARLMSQLDGGAVKVAEELGIEHVDLRATLPSNLTNYYDQMHFTPTGAARIADALASVVLHTTSTESVRRAS